MPPRLSGRENVMEHQFNRNAQLCIETVCNGERRTGTAKVVPDIVMCGGESWPGIEVEGFSGFINEVIAYAMNEGCVLADVIEGFEEGEPDIHWRVIHASSDDLRACRLDRAKLPQGMLIRTEDGKAFKTMAG